jgi:hypothetical protein
VVRSAGGWLFDQAMAGWDVTVITADQADPRPAHILGARARDLDTLLASPVWGPSLQAVAVQTDLYDADPRVRLLVLGIIDGAAEVRLWGEGWPGELEAAGPVPHQLSVAARAFKAQALAALPALPPPAAGSVSADPGQGAEVFRRARIRPVSLVTAG